MFAAEPDGGGRSLDLSDYVNYGRLPEEGIREVVRQVLEGLNAVHNVNMAHYDLKLDQILISHDYIVKITDFGLAKTLIGLNPDDDEDDKVVWMKVTGTRKGQVRTGYFFDNLDQQNMRTHMRGMWAPELKRVQDRLLEKDSLTGQ